MCLSKDKPEGQQHMGGKRVPESHCTVLYRSGHRHTCMEAPEASLSSKGSWDRSAKQFLMNVVFPSPDSPRISRLTYLSMILGGTCTARGLASASQPGDPVKLAAPCQSGKAQVLRGRQRACSRGTLAVGQQSLGSASAD